MFQNVFGIIRAEIPRMVPASIPLSRKNDTGSAISTAEFGGR
jgi:hypothetical protein